MANFNFFLFLYFFIVLLLHRFIGEVGKIIFKFSTITFLFFLFFFGFIPISHEGKQLLGKKSTTNSVFPF